MKAVVVHQHGGPEVMEYVADFPIRHLVTVTCWSAFARRR